MYIIIMENNAVEKILCETLSSSVLVFTLTMPTGNTYQTLYRGRQGWCRRNKAHPLHLSWPEMIHQELWHAFHNKMYNMNIIVISLNPLCTSDRSAWARPTIVALMADIHSCLGTPFLQMLMAMLLHGTPYGVSRLRLESLLRTELM